MFSNPLSSALAIALAVALCLSACGGGSSNDTQSQLTPGMLDPSFGSGGKVVTSIAGVGNAVALQSDGKIVVAGGPSVLRFNADGTLDIGFGAAGMAVSANFGAFSVALQPDGKIVAAGNFVDSSKGGFISCALIRYTSNGAIDASFGAGGIVIGNPLGNDVSACTGVVVQSDGKIVVAVRNGGGPLGTGGIARFSAGGILDGTFGVGGAVEAVGLVSGLMIAIQPDGKTLAAGWRNGHGFTGCTLARVDANGVLDPAFGKGGQVTWEGPLVDQAPGNCVIALQSDGEIIVVKNGNVGRFLANGAQDGGFAMGGTLTGVNGNAVALQSNGKIVVAGLAGTSSNSTGFKLWRLGTDGLLDSGIGNGGSVVTSLLDRGAAEAVAIQPDGRIVAAGWAETTAPPTPSNVAVTRYFGD